MGFEHPCECRPKHITSKILEQSPEGWAWAKMERQRCGSARGLEPPARGPGVAWVVVVVARSRGAAPGAWDAAAGWGTGKASHRPGCRVRASDNTGSVVGRDLRVTKYARAYTCILFLPERWESL